MDNNSQTKLVHYLDPHCIACKGESKKLKGLNLRVTIPRRMLTLISL